MLAAIVAGPLSASGVQVRAAARARGGDRADALTVGRALLAHPLPAQLTQIRCEHSGTHRICGLVVSGVKFKHPLDRRAFLDEVELLVRGAFAVAPLEEVDLWTTVPLDAGKGAVVSGDLAVATAATVFAVTVPRDALGRLDNQLESDRDIYWDPAFEDSLAKGKPQ